MAEKQVKIVAKVPLRAENGARIEVGGVVEVAQSAATILVKNNQAELVEDGKNGN